MASFAIKVKVGFDRRVAPPVQTIALLRAFGVSLNAHMLVSPASVRFLLILLLLHMPHFIAHSKEQSAVCPMRQQTVTKHVLVTAENWSFRRATNTLLRRCAISDAGNKRSD